VNKKLTLKKIKDFKNTPFKKVFIAASLNSKPITLFLLTEGVEKNYSMVRRLGRWRKENEKWYLSQFPVSPRRTKLWFVYHVTAQPDRLLFIISKRGKYVGHVGLFRFDFLKGSAEIDNVLRGEKEFKGIMEISILAVMRWGEQNLDIKNYSLKVLSDNTRAVRLYEKLGFKTIKKIPLHYEMSKTDGKILVEGNGGKKVKEYLVMNFYKKKL